MIRTDVEKRVVCIKRKALHSDTRLLHVLNKLYAGGDKIRHIRKDYMTKDLYEAAKRKFEDLKKCATGLEKESELGDYAFWEIFAIRSSKGLFDHLHAFKELIKAVSV